MHQNLGIELKKLYQKHDYIYIVYLPSCIGYRRQQRYLLVFKSSWHLSTTCGGGFTLSLLIAERQAGKL